MATTSQRFRLLIFLIGFAGFSVSGNAQETSAQEAAAELEPAVDVSATPRVAERVPSAEQRTVPGATQGTSGVMDQLDLGTTSITGNAELPKVLYIVPWKRSDLGNLVGRPVNTLMDEVLAPVDPEVFERHLDYYDTLYGESEQE